MIAWRHAVLGIWVSFMHVFLFFFCICTYSVQLSMFHMERCSRNTIIIMTTDCDGAVSVVFSPTSCAMKVIVV